ncbi:hypothetical protein PG997_007738 [Apiospora hydei]|uniref:N-acetyltransferase domain-containing protein n=1 Tax=Apiospora hydei TaxID=1337664 RepID=A0ABR1W8U4_9PEZI
MEHKVVYYLLSSYTQHDHPCTHATNHGGPRREPPKRPEIDVDDEGAIDDSEDLDDDMVQLQQIKSEARRRQSKPGESRIQQLLPFEYRLSNSAEICMGLFLTVASEKVQEFEIDTVRTAWPVETGRSAVSVLLAHVVATKCDGDVITDDAMDYPRDFRTVKSNSTKLGHQESGRTVALHSLAVHPKLQGCGLAKLLLKSYMQQVNNSGTADRISLICQQYLVDFYLRFGFKSLGQSNAKFGGGGWYDMTFTLGGPPKK